MTIYNISNDSSENCSEKNSGKKNAILHTFRLSNLGGILAKELFKFLLTEVFKIEMILCTVKNTVEVKQAYLFYIRHVQVTLTDNSFNPQAVFKLTYLCQFTTAFHYSTGKSEAKTAISLIPYRIGNSEQLYAFMNYRGL